MSKILSAAPRSYTGPILLVGGGLAVGAAIFFAVRRSNKTVEDVQRAVSGNVPPAQPATDVSSDTAQLVPPVEPGTGGYVQLRTTGYWPYTAKDSEKKMEGPPVGAAYWRTPSNPVVDPSTGKRVKLATVEMHRTNPAMYPYVGLSGDWDVWPWGQKIVIPWTDGGSIIGRVVDTGGHFTSIPGKPNTGKIYRVVGWEPIDVCVQSSKTKVPGKVVAQVVSGDNWEGGRAVATGGLRGQSVSLTGDVIEGRTTQDHDALARAIESNVGDRSAEEQVAAAWSMRNRADRGGVSLASLLAPRGVFGSPGKSGGYASTRKVATERSRKLVEEVLGASQAADPTEGATEFWVPEQQTRLNQLGDVYRAAASSGDEEKMRKYQRYAGYGSEGDVRVQHATDGLRVLRVVGAIELLGRRM